MSLSTIKPVLRECLEKGYALGAYNVYALCQVEALIKAHEKYDLPVIIQVADPSNGFLGGAENFMGSSTEVRKLGSQRIAKKVVEMAKKAKIKVVLHLDHGKSLEAIKNVIDAGFTSVMFDGSHLDYEENVAKTKEVVEYAKEHGVSTEAELGVLGGVEDDVTAEKSLFTQPNEALDFVKKTGVDCLAISYGTQHGANKGKNADLREDIVENIIRIFKANDIICPLVSHGSSNVPADIVADINALGGDVQNAHGIGFDKLQRVIKKGICKINIDTDIRLATTLEFKKYFSENNELTFKMKEVKAILDSNKALFDPRVYLQPVIEKVVTEYPVDEDVKLINKLMTKAVYNICERTIKAFIV